MLFATGLVLGIVAGVMVGAGTARKKRLRQIGAALKEGRVSIIGSGERPLNAEEFSVILDDEFRDA